MVGDARVLHVLANVEAVGLETVHSGVGYSCDGAFPSQQESGVE